MPAGNKEAGTPFTDTSPTLNRSDRYPTGKFTKVFPYFLSRFWNGKYIEFLVVLENEKNLGNNAPLYFAGNA
jgi:hypothetical protein